MDALIYLHSRKPPVIHRDIKPANIRITPEGQAVLVDFGLVKLYQSNMQTTVGARAITPGYSPPEQYGQGSTDERTDLYALGATLYMLLTGAHPPESVQRVASDTLRPAHVVNPAVPAHIGEAVQRAMALIPTARYQTVAEFKGALSEKPAGSQAPRFVQPAPVTMDARAVAAHPSLQEPIPAPISRPRKKGLPVWAIILIVLGALGGLTFACLGGLYLLGDSTLSLTETAESINTQEAAFAGTSTAVMAQQETAAAEFSATATAQVAMNDLNSLKASGVLIYGPEAGSLTHEEDNLIEVSKSLVNVRDFIAEVTFFNPYSAATGSFDIGFLFRHEDGNFQNRLIISSTGEWEVFNNTGEPDGELLASGFLSNFDDSEFGMNIVTLVARGDQGTLYVNDVLAGSFDLSARMNAGDIQAATGLYSGNEISGSATTFTGFSIWSLD